MSGKVLSSILTVQRFSRNLTRLLRQYSYDLLQEAEAKVQRDAAHFLRQQARHISRLIVEANNATSQRLVLSEDLSDLKKVKQYHLNHDEDNETDGQMDKDLEADELIITIEIQQLQQFFISGRAFQNFRNQLHDFLYPKENLKGYKKSSKAMTSDGQEQSIRLSLEYITAGLVVSPAGTVGHTNVERNPGWVINTLENMMVILACALEFLDISENITPGYKRLVYRCQCGYVAHDDYLESKENALKDFARDLRDSGLSSTCPSSTKLEVVL